MSLWDFQDPHFAALDSYSESSSVQRLKIAWWSASLGLILTRTGGKPKPELNCSVAKHTRLLPKLPSLAFAYQLLDWESVSASLGLVCLPSSFAY